MAITGFRRGEPAASASARVGLDSSQRAVLELGDAASAAVLGAPGTGKTTTLIELMADRVLERGWSTHEVLALTTARASATRLRDAIALRLARPTRGPMARTFNSLAFELAREAAREAGTAPPRFITGGEQDADIADLLAGNIEDGTGPVWPKELGPQVRGLGRFRSELRELMMRVVEFDLSPERLATLGAERAHPEWVAAAGFITEYRQVRALSGSGQLDGAELARSAVAAIGADEPPERVARLRLVVVDDLQEATGSMIAVLRALAARGVAVVAFGDPDVATNSFRGGEPDALGRMATVLGLPRATTIALTTAHRQGRELRAFTAAVTSRVGAAAAGTQRAAAPGATSDPVPLARIEAPSQARSLAAIARLLRERHLEHGVPWRDLAVVVRSNAQVPAVVRSLALAEVPARTTAAGRALREDPAARALIRLVDVGIGRTAMTPALATELLLGPFGRLDRLGLRRLRIALRAEEIAGSGNRPADALLVEALGEPGRLATIDASIGRSAARLAETLALLRSSEGSIEELLWLAWDRSGLARTWYEQATGGGLSAVDANRDLDAVLALFTAAKRHVERWPGTPPAAFLANMLDTEIAEDTLSPRSVEESVLVTTPAGAVGLEFDTVVVTGLQDGAWPNLRLRGSLLHPQELVHAVTGVESSVVDERRQVLGDELRMLALAVSRARRRVVLAAVANEDEPASAFLALLPAGTPVIESARLVPMTLRGLTGELRRRLVDARGRRAAEAAASLALLAAEGLAGADPADWHGLLPISSTAPLYEDEPVPVSPSALEKLLESPLDWFLERTAGSESGVIASVGTLVHWAMETAEDHSADGLWAAVEQRWGELLFEAPWLAERQRRIARGFTDALAEYLADFARAGKSLVGAERRFTLEVDRAIVSGSIDRVERASDGSVVIVDLKTGTPTKKQTEIDEHPQLAAYQLAYAEGVLDEALAEHGEHVAGGAKLVFVKEGLRERKYREGVQSPLDPEGLEAFRERVRAASALIAAAEFEGALELPTFGRGDPSRLRLHRVRAVSSD